MPNYYKTYVLYTLANIKYQISEIFSNINLVDISFDFALGDAIKSFRAKDSYVKLK